jgi:RNA-directed DNA polymerase
MFFDISSKAQLARFLGIAPGEIDHVLHRLHKSYRPQRFRKADNSFRNLLVPQGKLKLLQTKIKTHILDVVPALPCVHGGVRRRSICSNARPHVAKAVVFTIDIKDFFPHIDPERVLRIFQAMGFREEAAEILTKATTWKHQLPQGVATSTALANLSLVRVDDRIQRLAGLHGFAYTRFVDDLTLSGDWRLLKFRRLIPRIVESEGFSIKPEKTMTMDRGARQMVTKLVVNSKINIGKERRRGIRKEVFDHRREHHAEALTPRVQGLVYWLRQVNAPVGEKLLNRVATQDSSDR